MWAWISGISNKNFASTLDNKFSDLRYMWRSVVEMISVHTSFVCMSTELQALHPSYSVVTGSGVGEQSVMYRQAVYESLRSYLKSKSLS